MIFFISPTAQAVDVFLNVGRDCPPETKASFIHAMVCQESCTSFSVCTFPVANITSALL